MSRTLRGLDLLAYGLLALCVAASILRPLFYWDSWAYHLPFSALLWDIGDARKAFVLSEEMQVRYEGFPLMAELIQGGLWKLTGTINATALINSAAVSVFVVAAARALGLSFAMLVFGVLAVPLVSMHAVSSYIDLFVGACIALQALSAIRIEEALRRRRAGLLSWCGVFIGCAALAGNAKITAVVMSVAIGGFLAAYLLRSRAEFDRRRVAVVALAIVAAAVLASGTVLKNAYRFGNPLYPFDTTVAGVHLDGPEPEYRSYPAYTASLGPLARPVNWALSISDIDWVIRGRSADYTIDMAASGDTPQVTQPRTGGYWGPLIGASVALAVWLYVRTRRQNPAALRDRRFLLALLLFVTAVTAFMPQSHELRYHLHWPLMLMLTIAVLAKTAELTAPARSAIAVAYLAAFVASQWVVDWPWRPWQPLTQAASLEAETQAPPLDVVRARAATCLGPSVSPRQFAYSAVFHGGDYVVEQGWTRCSRFPAP